jgi:hypothetical protein
VSPSLTLKITFGILNPLIISNFYKFFLCPKPVLGKGKDPRRKDLSTIIKKKNISIFKWGKDI